jgi:hypothetical protein
VSEEKDESLFSLMPPIRKFHPVILILGFALMNVFAFVYRSQMQFHLKMVAMALSFFFLLLAVTFEVQRLEKDRGRKRKN